jgi:Na+/H+ antiporter NhaC
MTLGKIIRYSFTLLICTALGIGIYFMRIDITKNFNNSLIDAFFVSGFSFVLLGALILIGQQGTFDMLAFSVKKVFFVIFNQKKGMQHYHEYLEERQEKPKLSVLNYFIVGGSFVIISIILLLIFQAW